MIENTGLTPVEEAENITLTYICVRTVEASCLSDHPGHQTLGR